MSDTPKTDQGHQDSKVLNQGIPDKDWPWSAINAGWDFARELEREQNALIVKLEALAKKWDEFMIPNADYFDDGKMKGMENCAADLYSLIQEAKQ